MIEKITSLANNKIKKVFKLSKDQKLRQKEGLIVVDGLREVEEAIKANWKVLEFFYCEELIKDNKNLNKIIKCSQHVYNLSKKAFEKISYKKTPDGYLAILKSKVLKFSDLIIKENPLILVLESLEKPGNLGAIIRTAYASGVDLIILNNQKTDLYSPNTIRSSTGFIFSMPLIISSVPKTLKYLQKNNINILSTSLSAEKSHFSVDFKTGRAIVFGSEAFGLSPLWLKNEVESIKIPMIKGVDSLNVSVSVAIIVYEALRQRKFLIK